MSVYQRIAMNLGATEPVNGSWIQAIAQEYGVMNPVNGSWIQAIANSLGATDAVNGSWFQAIANQLGTYVLTTNPTWLEEWAHLTDEPPLPPVAPIAGFTVSNTTPVEGTSIQFIDTSMNRPSTWLWNFGDGTTSTLPNPSHIYASVGTYTVSLTVTNSAGTDTETKVDYITPTLAPVAPVASFTVDNTTPSIDVEISFTDTSTNTPTSWLWNFGDGTTSTVKNPKHTYSVDGNYTVSLKVTNVAGSDTETKVDYITVTLAPALVTVTGGIKTTNGGYTYRTFNSNGNLVVSNDSVNIEYLIVGGGGNGQKRVGAAGGGGGGQVLTNEGTPEAIGAATYPIVIASALGSSSFNSITAVNGSSGYGSGSGGASGNGFGGATGGGGAGSAGGGKHGGIGLQVFGNYYGGGGGGSNSNGPDTGQGGQGGGGNAGTLYDNGQGGAPNTGGGGGAGGIAGSGYDGGAGGSGIVVVRYLTLPTD